MSGQNNNHPRPAQNAATLSIAVLSRQLVPFNGEREGLNKFLSVSEKALDLCQEEEKNVLFELIKMQLHGKAYDLTPHRLIENWNKLKVLLEEIFSDKRSQGQWEMEMHSCKQGPQEKVIDFANRLENSMVKLINCVTAGVERNVAESFGTLIRNQARNVFLVGLLEPLNILVKLRNPNSLETAIELAVAEEREMISRKETQSMFGINNSKQACQLCGKLNHSAKNCYQFLNTKKKVLSIESNEKFCRYCKRKGHLLEECRTREENNKKYSNNPQNRTFRSKNSSNNYRPNNSNNLNGENLSSNGNKKGVLQINAVNLK